MLRALAVSIVAASVLLAACTPQPVEEPAASSDSGEALASTRWTLQALGNDAAAGRPSITLDFSADGTFGGNDGCNQYQGRYSADQESIEIDDDLIGTLMACADSVEARARAYREALKLSATFDLGDGRLTLNDLSGRLLASFEPAPTWPDGVSGWEVIGYNNGRQGVVSVDMGTGITASFGAAGQVTGSAGCNQYFASYQLEGQTISIGPAGATQRTCAEPDGLMRQEALYLEALQSAATFRLDGARLELRRADGALAVSFARVDE